MEVKRIAAFLLKNLQKILVLMSNTSLKKKIVYDIKHQDVYTIFEDLSGNTFDEQGKPIDLSSLLNNANDWDDTPAQFGIYEVKEKKESSSKLK